MKIQCKYWGAIYGGGRCSLKNATVSFGTCTFGCLESDGEWRSAAKEELNQKIEQDSKNNFINFSKESEAGKEKMNTCINRSTEKESRAVKTCCGQKLIEGYACIAANVFPTSPAKCAGCALFIKS